jgi:hypothetical protein
METLGILEIEGTKSSPAINFNPNGHLMIKGRAMPDNATHIFKPLLAWVELLQVKKVLFEINLDYLNTSCSMQLFTLLRKLEENQSIDELTVKWYFEEDDEDHYDTGLFYEEKLSRTKFIYLSTINNTRQ